jgi:hypothetical protein
MATKSKIQLLVEVMGDDELNSHQIQERYQAVSKYGMSINQLTNFLRTRKPFERIGKTEVQLLNRKKKGYTLWRVNPQWRDEL